MNFGLMEEMGFDAPQMKSLLLTKPKLWLMSKSRSYLIKFIKCAVLHFSFITAFLDTQTNRY